jgi:DNA-binding MarR family transcriptional regulator
VVSDRAARDLRADILESFTQLMEHVTRWRQLDMADVEVTMPQARCLLLISLHPSMSISALASHLHIGLPSASGLVERLVEAGYVERNPDPRDRRQQLVTLSGRGRSLVDRLHELPSAKLSELLAGLSLAELRGLRLGVLAIEREAGLIAERTPPKHDPERTTA